MSFILRLNFASSTSWGVFGLKSISTTMYVSLIQLSFDPVSHQVTLATYTSYDESLEYGKSTPNNSNDILIVMRCRFSISLLFLVITVMT